MECLVVQVIGNTTTRTAPIAPTAPKKPSIYGADLNKVETSRFIHKAAISESNQAVSIKCTGYEFEPLIVVVIKNINTTLSFDLNNFDNPDGTFKISSADTGNLITSFEGKKGLVSIAATFNTDGFYIISKDNQILGGIVVVDDLKTVDLEKLRTDYIGG